MRANQHASYDDHRRSHGRRHLPSLTWSRPCAPTLHAEDVWSWTTSDPIRSVNAEIDFKAREPRCCTHRCILKSESQRIDPSQPETVPTFSQWSERPGHRNRHLPQRTYCRGRPATIHAERSRKLEQAPPPAATPPTTGCNLSPFIYDSDFARGNRGGLSRGLSRISANLFIAMAP